VTLLEQLKIRKRAKVSRAKSLTRHCQNRDCPTRGGIATKVVKPRMGKLGYVYFSNQDKQYLHASCRGHNPRKKKKNPENRWHNQAREIRALSPTQIEESIRSLKAQDEINPGKLIRRG